MKNNRASNQANKIHDKAIPSANGITSNAKVGLSKIRSAKSPAKVRAIETGTNRETRKRPSNRWGGFPSWNLPLFCDT
jgi:hypothetical protein